MALLTSLNTETPWQLRRCDARDFVGRVKAGLRRATEAGVITPSDARKVVLDYVVGRQAFTQPFGGAAGVTNTVTITSRILWSVVAIACAEVAASALAPRTPIPAAPSRATLALVTACVGVVGQRQCGVEHRIRALGLVTGHVLASVRTVDLVPLFAHVLGCALVTIAGGPRREWPAWRVPLCDAMRTTGARLRFFGDETLSPITVLEPCWHHLLGWWAEYEIWAAAPPVPGWGYADTAPGSSVSAVPNPVVAFLEMFQHDNWFDIGPWFARDLATRWADHDPITPRATSDLLMAVSELTSL
jgi:hypothetical protein